MSSEETVQAPSFNIWIAKVPQPAATQQPTDKIKMWIRGKQEQIEDERLQNFNEEFNAHVTELVIHETMQAADSFTIKMIDPNQEFMFGEDLYIGRYIFIDIGMGDKVVHKIDGFINAMAYEFPENGLPVLVIDGYGTVWDRMSKDVRNWKVNVGEYPQVQNPTYYNKTYSSLKEFFDEMARIYELEAIDWGRTVPSDLESKVYLTFDELLEGKTPEFKGFPNGRRSAWDFMNRLADNMGCIFFIKGRELHFYPAAWIDAPVDFERRAADKESSIEDAIQKENQKPSPDLGLVNKYLKQKSNLQQAKTEYTKDASPSSKGARMGKTLWYKMDNVLDEDGTLGSGKGYNLLAFKPELQNLQVGGYFGMAMDPASGRITFGKATEDDNLGAIMSGDRNAVSDYDPQTGQLKYADKVVDQTGLKIVKNKPATVKSPTPPGVAALGKKDKPTEQNTNPSLFAKIKQQAKETTQKVLSKIGEKLAVSEFEVRHTPAKLPTRTMEPQAGKTLQEMDGLAAASFRNWMWFAKATALTVGDPDLTVAIPIWVYGMGTPQQLKDGRHNSKICGKWYTWSVSHRITTNKAYLCELELRRFWQFAKPVTPGDDDHTDTSKRDMNALNIDKPFGIRVKDLGKVK